MELAELKKRDLKRNHLMVIDNTLDMYKNYPIPDVKIDSAKEILEMESYKSQKIKRSTKS
jgi:hypothetical protein